MVWQNFLKQVLPEKFIEVHPEILSSLEEMKIASDNTSNKQTVYNNGVLIILNGGENDEAVKLLEAVDVKELNRGDTFLETSSADTLEKIDTNFWSNSVQKRLAIYDNMVPSRDYHILEAAVFIQEMYDQGDVVDQYLRDVAIRYKQRGSMISHLYSAGYFDTLIAPLYKDLMQSETPSVKEYWGLYELIVTESPLALFISRRDDQNEVTKKVLEKIKINQSSGIYYLNIHGIGAFNKTHIMNALKEKSISDMLVGEPEISTENRMTTVTIFYKQK